MWQFLIPAGIQAASALLQKRPRTPNPRNTEYGRFLGRVQNEGVYSPAVRASILGRVGGVTGNVAQGRTADLRGRLASMGMLDSVAGARMLDAPGRQRMRTLGDAAANLGSMNEMTKYEAGKELAGLMHNYRGIRSQERAEDFNTRLSGLLGAAGTAYDGYRQNQMMEQMPPMNPITGGAMVNIPPELGSMSEGDAYAWAKNLGHDWKEIRDLWDRARQDKMMSDLEESGNSYFGRGIRMPDFRGR